LSIQTYYRYKTTFLGQTIPSWDTYWQGEGPCGVRHLWAPSYSPNLPPDPGSPMTYNPESVTTWRDGALNNGHTYSIPPYRPTSYSIGRKINREHLVLHHFGSSSGNYAARQYGKVSYSGGQCVPTPLSLVYEGPTYSLWDEQTRDFSEHPLYYKTQFDDSEINIALDSVRNEAVSEALTSYDILTDISQIKDIPRTVTQVSGDLVKILTALKSRHGKGVMKAAARMSPRALLKSANKLFRQFGADWLAYRYGIMPMLYSYRDIVKTTNRGTDVKTKKVISIHAKETDTNWQALSSGFYRMIENVGEVKVSCSVFQHFTSAEVASLTGLGVNPLVTAWELIPYSFVIDWFVDVGSYIAAATATNWSQIKYACLSRRDSRTKKTWVHKPDQSINMPIGNFLPVNWWGDPPGDHPSLEIKNEEGLYILDEEEIDSYSRWVIPVSSAPLRYNPSLSWRRLVDGAALSINNLGRLIKGLK